MKTPVFPSLRRSRGAFALVTTLLILSLLAIVAVSYLSSMSAERQTAEAYGSKASAEQIAQAGVDSATAMLAESFRDFPDSATVWDTTQTTNGGTPYNTAIVGGTYNEGTSLYLRAVPMTSNGTTVANPLPHGSATGAGGTAYPANDASGNNPNNPACQNFVLPLISGVQSGQARLVSAKSAIFSKAMNLNVPDPVQQNWTDLNVRRSSSDLQGFIGSPPGWNGVGPKPARAYWVNMNGSNGLVTGRYAFWMEDESFKANSSLLGSGTNPPDNTFRPTSGSPAVARVQQPNDLTLLGPLTAAQTVDTAIGKSLLDPATTAGNITSVRQQSYPGNFFPDLLSFSHAFDNTTTQGTNTVDALRYLTTNQSSALNLSRHGSQRLNLNTAISTTIDSNVIQKQVNEIVETMEYHLPYLGERFYRTSSAANLNDATQVSGSPYSGSYSSATDGSDSQIYYYKIAANLRDYIDTDSQPTVIGQNGIVMSAPLNRPLNETGVNQIWAQGKECTPYIQEVAVRYRPVITYTTGAASGRYSLSVDYYIELWNMSDRDITAAQMNSPSIWVRDQQSWTTYYYGDTMVADSPTDDLPSNSPPDDVQIDLKGVTFRAGAVTVITTDPSYATYTYTELASNGASGATHNGKTNHPSSTLPNLSNVFLCPVISGNRTFAGTIYPSTPSKATVNSVGLRLGTPYVQLPYTSSPPNPYSCTEVSLVNSSGYFDVVRGAITKTGSTNIYTVAYNNYPGGTAQGGYEDFSYGSSLMGNVQDTGGGPTPGSEMPTVSQLGDPRTNNEQLSVNDAATTGADGTRFMASSRTLGSPNYPALQPDTATVGESWPDYYKFPAVTNTSYPSPDYTNAPVVVAGATTTDGPLVSIGQLGDIFDPARVPNPSISPVSTSILSSHGGGRTLKIGQHDDLYSDNPATNVYASGVSNSTSSDSVPASNGWASWRLTDIFDVSDPIQLPGRININGFMRDNGAAFLSLLQGFAFQPTTSPNTSTTYDPNVHGDGVSGIAGTSLDTTGGSKGYSQITKQMQQRLDAVALSANHQPVSPFFERGELSELGVSAAYNNNNPLFSTGTMLTGVNMGSVTDHSREEIFRRTAQMICTKGDTFTVYAAGQSIIQTTVGGPMKITSTQRLRVTFRLVPKSKDSSTGTFTDFHPAYIVNSDGTLTQNTFDPSNPNAQPALNASGAVGVNSRFAKPDRYDVQVLQVLSY